MERGSSRKQCLHYVRQAFTALVLFVGIVVAGCQPQNDAARTMSAKATALYKADILALDRPFKLELYVGNPLDGYDSVVVDSSGTVRSVAQEQVQGPARSIPPYKSVEFDLSPEKVEGIRQEVVESGFHSLGSVYRDPSVIDGTSVLVRVTVADKHKVVCCHNRFPKAIRALRAYLQSEVVDPNRQAAGGSLRQVLIEQTIPPFECE